MFNYKPLWKTMKDRDISAYTLIKDYNFNTRTIYNLRHDKSITMHTLEKLCHTLKCTPNDVIEIEE